MKPNGELFAPPPAPVPSRSKRDKLARQYSQKSHSSINALPQRPEWSNPAVESQVASRSERLKLLDWHYLVGILGLLGLIFLVTWLSVSLTGTNR